MALPIDTVCQRLADCELDSKGYVPGDLRDELMRNLQAQNRTCFDCPSRNPTWVSLPFGVFMCLDCSGEHRRMGTHITFVRSASMDNFFPGQIVSMYLGGNAKIMEELKKSGISLKRKQAASGTGGRVDFFGKPMQRLFQSMLRDTERKCKMFGIPMYSLGGSGAGNTPAKPAISNPPAAAAPVVDTQPPEKEASPANISSAPSFDDAPAKPTFVIKQKAPQGAAPAFAPAAITPVVKKTTALPSGGGLDDDFDDWFDELEKVDTQDKQAMAQAETKASVPQPAPKVEDFAATIKAAQPVVQKPVQHAAPVRQPDPVQSKAPLGSGGALFANNTFSANPGNQVPQDNWKKVENRKGFGSSDLYGNSGQNQDAGRLQNFAGANAISSDMYHGRQDSTSSWGDIDVQKEMAIEKAREFAQKAHSKGSEWFDKMFRS